MYKRCHQYIYDFRERKIGHLNDHLYNAMVKYGFDSFSMVPLEFVSDPVQMTIRELYWMDFFKTTDRRFGYNLRRDSQIGMITHPETSEKIKANLRRQWANGERDGHSEKLKKSWTVASPKRRIEQAAMFKKYKTKYRYNVTIHDTTFLADYAMLKILKLHNCVAEFHRSKSDSVTVKGIQITRERI